MNATTKPLLPRIRAVPALSRGIAVLRLLGRSATPLGVHAIARELGLVPSTCLHILRVLAAERLVSVEPSSKTYRLGSGLVALARGALRQPGFAALVQPVLQEVSQRHGATAIAVEASGLDHMVVVALARTQSALRVDVDIGSRFPALISATGRCVAAFGDHSWSEMKQRFRTLRWDVPPSWSAWREEVEDVKRLGYAVDDGSYIRGVSIVSAPVRMPDGAINALVVVGVGEQMRRTGLAAIGEELRERALVVTQSLGGRGYRGDFGIYPASIAHR
jgi:DNA-binding IclR family transcriptional regulator